MAKESTRNAYVYRLRTKELVEVEGDRIRATSAASIALPDAEPLPTGKALQDYWLARLPHGERTILQLLLDPDVRRPLMREQITESTGFKESTRNAYIYRLMSKRLVVIVDGLVAASPTLLS